MGIRSGLHLYLHSSSDSLPVFSASRVGTMIVPALILLFLFPPHVAVGTSMFIVFLSAIVNSITHISSGHVPWLYALAVIPGAYIGGMIGTMLNKKMSSETLVLVLRIMLLLFGVRSIIDGIWG